MFFMSTDNGFFANAVNRQQSTDNGRLAGGGVTVINEIIFLTEEQKDMFFMSTDNGQRTTAPSGWWGDGYQ